MKAIVLTTLALWFVAVAVYGLFYVGSRISLPGLEGYEKDWSWQLIFFALTRLPWLLLALALILLVEYLLLRKR